LVFGHLPDAGFESLKFTGASLSDVGPAARQDDKLP